MKYRALFAGGAVAVLATVVACSGGSSDRASVGNDEIIGGVDAKSAALDAVGALMFKDPQQNDAMQMLCTATLIAPRVILTAKHCALDKGVDQSDGGSGLVTETRFLDVYKMYFAIGADSSAPRRLVQAESVETCNVANTGWMGLGCDVSVYHLAESVDDVRPLTVAPASVGEDAVGKHMSAIGFGKQEQVGMVYGTRKAGTLTMRSTHGAPMQTLFPTVDGFLDAVRAGEGEAYVDNADAALRAFYNLPLLDGYEAYAGGADGDAQICSGDSGGPLLAKINGELVIQGVASGVVSGVRLPCKLGSAYATFGPKAQELIASALKDPCEGIPAEGRCEGNVAVRCTTSVEGPRRITRTDCGELLQRCSVPAPSDAGAGDGGGAGNASDASVGIGPNADGGLPFDAGGPVPLPPPVRRVECTD